MREVGAVHPGREVSEAEQRGSPSSSSAQAGRQQEEEVRQRERGEMPSSSHAQGCAAYSPSFFLPSQKEKIVRRDEARRKQRRHGAAMP